ncbi:hypothetical protein ASPWEDRAFT_746562 [Aspergillus wentii DTO 134E9]|uniref:F-box domain-containing protein n=1 Tax=Aspergillus wentii DTO 134E9 TaxID=1073089 RepID=A0A1L9R7Q6_ASPWE|nr:uncharacterized protein ASPWEDRAFT_746562 [Aspergillus wentii DTO 134E9]KAI9927542.1 hypothetical protein MW887_003160 [Aspergillus wentii]OJJ30918.1 hypothetical protein ASPWEDRAFT_746562 [Aspergillus wentii DTO 134E9]
MASPPSNVFFIWELLEHILLNLDLRTLLLSQKVCRTWHKTINDSRPLQQALFFQPMEGSDTPEQKRTRNPLLEEALYPQFKFNTYYYKLSRGRKHTNHLSDIQPGAYTRQEASWRRMLIQQPPTSIIGVIEVFTRDMQDRYYKQLLVKPHNGHLRMGDLYDPLNEWTLYPCLEKWAFWDESVETQFWLSEEARSATLKAALRECDIFVYSYFTCKALRPWMKVGAPRGADVWLQKLQITGPRYYPRYANMPDIIYPCPAFKLIE